MLLQISLFHVSEQRSKLILNIKSCIQGFDFGFVKDFKKAIVEGAGGTTAVYGVHRFLCNLRFETQTG